MVCVREDLLETRQTTYIVMLTVEHLKRESVYRAYTLHFQMRQIKVYLLEPSKLCEVLLKINIGAIPI